MAATYRQWLQSKANVGNKDAWLALDYQGDDTGIDYGRLNNDYAWGRPGAYATKTVFGKSYNREQAIAAMEGMANEYIAAHTGANDTGSTSSSGSGSSSRGGSGSSTYDPQAMAYYDDQISSANNSLGRIGNQRTVGKENIQNSYNQAWNKLMSDKAIAERDYRIKSDRAREDNTSARNAIYQTIGSTVAGLKRLLGSSGAGNSSAAKYMVPLAVGRQGTEQIGNTQKTYARNQQGLDTAWGDTGRQVEEGIAGLDRQKFEKEQELESGLKQSEASILEQLANLTIAKEQAAGKNYTQAREATQGYTSRIQDLLGAIDGLGKKYSGTVMQAGDVKYAAPSLESYATPNFDVGGQTETAAPTDIISPYLAALFKDKNANQVV